jgi:hypothetical protein
MWVVQPRSGVASAVLPGLGARQEPIKGLLLVPIRRERQRDLREPIAPSALVKGQSHRHIGALEQLFPVRQEAIDQPRKAWSGGVKGSADGIGSHLLQLAGNNGGEQEQASLWTLRIGESSVLTGVLG